MVGKKLRVYFLVGLKEFGLEQKVPVKQELEILDIVEKHTRRVCQAEFH